MTERTRATEGEPSSMSECARIAALPEGLALVRSKDGLALEGYGMSLTADFTPLLARTKPYLLSQELLVRAAKIKGVAQPVAVDATAGLGEDAFVLAAAGFYVTMYERNPVIAALVRDALNRAAALPGTAAIVARLTLVEDDSLNALGALTTRPDVVYLDPMFPARTKSAAVKKKFQLIGRLEQPCKEPEALMHAALAACPRKIVVKRPPKAAPLAQIKPSYAITGKAVRYDVIVPPHT